MSQNSLFEEEQQIIIFIFCYTESFFSRQSIYGNSRLGWRSKGIKCTRFFQGVKNIKIFLLNLSEMYNFAMLIPQLG